MGGSYRHYLEQRKRGELVFTWSSVQYLYSLIATLFGLDILELVWAALHLVNKYEEVFVLLSFFAGWNAINKEARLPSVIKGEAS